MSTYPYSLKDFEEAYEKTGFTPKEGHTLIEYEVCGCPQGVLALHKAQKRPTHEMVAWTIDILDITEAQFYACADAFDDGEMFKYLHDQTQEERDAFEVGLACRKRFLGLD